MTLILATLVLGLTAIAWFSTPVPRRVPVRRSDRIRAKRTDTRF